MTFKTRLQTILKSLRHIPKRYLIIGGLAVAVLFYVAAFHGRTLTYAYAGETCDRQAVFLPRLLKQSGSSKYDITTKGGLAIKGYPLITTSVCVSPTEAPQKDSDETVHLSPFGGIVARLSYKIDVPPPPEVKTDKLNSPIPTSRVTSLPLSVPDETFKYALKNNDATASCQVKNSALECDVPALKLVQGETYDIALERYFKNKSLGVIAKKSVQTLSPVSVKTASIDSGAVVYDKPTDVVITADKPLEKAEFTLKRVSDEGEVIPVSSSINGSEVKVEFSKELPRSAEFELAATTLEAKDGSTPLDEYKLAFKTSGGPQVTAVNVGASGVAQNATIVLTFDQELHPSQVVNSVVTVAGVPATITKQARTVTIQLSGAPKCQDFTITTNKDIKSKHDITNTANWSRTQRTTCHSVSVVGYSKQGRAITAYEFGNGTRTILFVGAIHGNELSTYSLMQRWISELEARAKEIPSDKRIVIVPQINPDGVARGSRVNANNIDLNRNFATDDWQKDITTVGNQPFPGGGGESPMSEPEAKAMAAFASRLRPELTLSYHSIGGLLMANGAGRSNALASTYSQISGYRNSTGQSDTTFDYAISGTWDDWLAQKLGAPSILIELGSHSYHQFERNQAAMWAMVKS